MIFFLLSCITGYRLNFCKEVEQSRVPQVTIAESEVEKYEETIKKLWDKGAIEPCEWEKDQFVSHFF